MCTTIGQIRQKKSDRKHDAKRYPKTREVGNPGRDPRGGLPRGGDRVLDAKGGRDRWGDLGRPGRGDQRRGRRGRPQGAAGGAQCGVGGLAEGPVC